MCIRDRAYTLEVVELAGDDPGYTDSDPAKASTTTADEPVVVTSPWVNVEFSYETVGGKGTLRVANKDVYKRQVLGNVLINYDN